MWTLAWQFACAVSPDGGVFACFKATQESCRPVVALKQWSGISLSMCHQQQVLVKGQVQERLVFGLPWPCLSMFWMTADFDSQDLVGVSCQFFHDPAVDVTSEQHSQCKVSVSMLLFVLRIVLYGRAKELAKQEASEPERLAAAAHLVLRTRCK